jgi:hypothetical protein
VGLVQSHYYIQPETVLDLVQIGNNNVTYWRCLKMLGLLLEGVVCLGSVPLIDQISSEKERLGWIHMVMMQQEVI